MLIMAQLHMGSNIEWQRWVVRHGDSLEDAKYFDYHNAAYTYFLKCKAIDEHFAHIDNDSRNDRKRYTTKPLTEIIKLTLPDDTILHFLNMEKVDKWYSDNGIHPAWRRYKTEKITITDAQKRNLTLTD